MSPFPNSHPAHGPSDAAANVAAKNGGYSLKHRELTQDEREQYRLHVQQVGSRNPFYLWIRDHPYRFLALELAFALFAVIAVASSGAVNSAASAGVGFVYFCCGVAALQLLFVVSHATSHALMLEYDAHKPGHPRTSEQSIVYFFAFYHHHHSRSDDWAPELSYHDPQERHIFEDWGTLGVIASHWSSFSFLNFIDQPIVWIPVFAFACVTMWFAPMTALFWVGYEVGVLLLPGGHAYQHIRASRMPPLLRYTLKFLDLTGVIAGRAEHGPHHHHTSDLVYQSFGSSGLYMKYIGVGQAFDRLIDWLWRRNFMRGLKGDMKPYDYWLPLQWASGPVALWLLPGILAYYSA